MNKYCYKKTRDLRKQIIFQEKLFLIIFPIIFLIYAWGYLFLPGLITNYHAWSSYIALSFSQIRRTSSCIIRLSTEGQLIGEMYILDASQGGAGNSPPRFFFFFNRFDRCVHIIIAYMLGSENTWIQDNAIRLQVCIMIQIHR